MQFCGVFLDLLCFVSQKSWNSKGRNHLWFSCRFSAFDRNWQRENFWKDWAQSNDQSESYIHLKSNEKVKSANVIEQIMSVIV